MHTNVHSTTCATALLLLTACSGNNYYYTSPGGGSQVGTTAPDLGSPVSPDAGLAPQPPTNGATGGATNGSTSGANSGGATSGFTTASVGGSSGVADAAPPALVLTLPEFFAARAEADCKRRFECCSVDAQATSFLGSTIEECVFNENAHFRDWSPNYPTGASARAVYDGVGAAACVNATLAMGCADFVSGGFESGPWKACDDHSFVKPLVALDEHCTNSFECFGEAYCTAQGDSTADGYCFRLNSNGESCWANYGCKSGYCDATTDSCAPNPRSIDRCN